MRKVLLTIMSSVAVGLAFCGTAFATEGSVTSNILRLYYYEGHSGLLVIVANMSDLGGCGSAGWFLLPNTHVHYKEMTALLFSADAQGKQENLTISDCFQGYGRIKHAMLIS